MTAGVTSNATIKRNIIYNVLGGSWAILLNLLAARVIIRQLGPEVYGIAGFGTTLQALFALFDLGLVITVTREIATDTSENHQQSWRLVQTAVSIYWLVSLTIGLALVIAAPWIVRYWFTFEKLDLDTATLAFRGLSLATAFNWPMGIYMGTLTGVQRLDIVNRVRFISVTSYLGIGVILLYLIPNVALYMAWNALTSLFGLSLYAMSTYRMLPGLPIRPLISWSVLRHIRQFASQIYLSALLALLFAQSDRFLIGKVLPATELGFYNLAITIVMGIAAIQSLISSALMPAMAADFGQGDLVMLHDHYYKLTQILVYVITLPVFISIFYGRDLLILWTTPETAEGAYRSLGLLAFGSLLNAVVSAGYHLSVATGNARYVLRVNLIVLVPYIAILFVLVINFGIEGAALTWVLLNLYYLLTFMPLVHHRIMAEPIRKWLSKGLVPFMTTALVCFGLGWLSGFALHWAGKPCIWFICLVCSLVYLGTGYRLLDAGIHEILWTNSEPI